jgi:hypothetical protein
MKSFSYEKEIEEYRAKIYKPYVLSALLYLQCIFFLKSAPECAVFDPYKS